MINWTPNSNTDYRFHVYNVAIEHVIRQGGCEIILADESDLLDVQFEPGPNNLVFSFAVQHHSPPFTDAEIEANMHIKTHRQCFELIAPGNRIQKHHNPLIVIPWSQHREYLHREYLLCYVNRDFYRPITQVTATLKVHEGLIVPRWAPHTA